MNELEKNIVLSLVDQPSLIQTVEVEPQWFHDQRLSTLVKFLNDAHGDFKGFAALRAAFNEAYPDTVHEQDWAELANSKSYRYEFKGYLRNLKQAYLQNNLAHAAQIYATTKDPEALTNLKTQIAAMDEPQELPTKSLQELGQELVKSMQTPVKPGIRSYAMLDNFTQSGLQGGNLFILAARPSVGKSAFATNLIYRALMNNDSMRIDFFNLEMTQMPIYKRLASISSGIKKKLMYNPYQQLSDAQKTRLANSTVDLAKNDLMIYDDRFKLDQIISTIRQRFVGAQQGHYMVVIDYLQLIELRGAGNKSRYESVSDITRALKLVTNELNIPIILLSQLNRAVENRPDKRPMMSDLRESGSIEQDANMIAFLYRKDPEDAVEPVEYLVFDLQKNREGALGKAYLKFEKPIQYMSEAKLLDDE